MRRDLAVTAAALVLVVASAALGVAQEMPQGRMQGSGMGPGQMGSQGMGPGAMGEEQGGRMVDRMQMMQQMMGMMRHMMEMGPMSPEQRQAMAAQCQQMMAQPDPTLGAPQAR